jgi:predicted HicB family RNase H-like nuclease
VPEPAPSPANKRAKVDDGKMTTSMRIEPEKLEALKIIAARERVRVNELVMQGVDHVIALHKQGRAA